MAFMCDRLTNDLPFSIRHSYIKPEIQIAKYGNIKKASLPGE